MQDLSPTGSDFPLNAKLISGLLLFTFTLILIFKLYLASALDLYSDEIFYWLASSKPALAYSDLPFVTALLIGTGNLLESSSTLATRSLFLIMGSTLPLLVYWIAKPLTNQQQALESALLTLCLPLGAFLGLLAVPDAPLLFFGVLSIGSFERALRVNSLKYWIATGIFVALGLSTHYRFFLYPAAAILFLLIFKAEKKQWKNPRLWLSMAIASTGLVPILWFNLSNQLSSASFYFVDRHPWEFQPSGLLHVFKQAGLVTPLLYGVFIFTLYQIYLKSKQGVRGAALMLSFALPNLLVYLILAPWTDATSTSIHWPLSGYFPLLVFAPASLRLIYANAAKKWGTQTARRVLVSIPTLGFLGSIIALVGVGSQAFQLPLQQIIGPGILSNKMAGWTQFANFTEELVASELPEQQALLITDNYYTLAQLEFFRLSSDSITLDRDKAVRDGRIAQYEIWSKEESGLSSHLGQAALFITEDSTLSVIDKTEVITRMCQYSSAIERIGELTLFNGDKKFSYYRIASIVNSQARQDYRAYPCPFPARAWIDQPVEASVLSGMSAINGWAYNEDIGVEGVYLLIDGKRIASLNYGVSRPDVAQAMNVQNDPNLPDLGYDLDFDTSQLGNGDYKLAIEIVNLAGTSEIYGERRVSVIN